MQSEIRRHLAIDALEMAWLHRSPDRSARPIFHSDRGCQYASYEFSQLLRQCGITASMSRKGNCWGNALSEPLFASLKVPNGCFVEAHFGPKGRQPTLFLTVVFKADCLILIPEGIPIFGASSRG